MLEMGTCLESVPHRQKILEGKIPSGIKGGGTKGEPRQCIQPGTPVQFIL